VRPTDVIAILGGDLHLQEKAPVARSAEPDWFAAMARTLRQIRKLQKLYDDCPIFLPGDVFDKWNASPALINWAMDHLPRRICSVAGNHDLPLHSYADIRKSAYWTLVRSETIEHLEYGKPRVFVQPLGARHLHAYGFSNGQDYTKIKPINPNTINLAVIHQYCWKTGHAFPGASPDDYYLEHWDRLKAAGYSAAVFGDNHKGFYVSTGLANGLVNPGTMMCRTTDERKYVPFVGLLLSTGEVVPCYLDTAEDVWTDEKEAAAETDDNTEFLKELAALGDVSMNFTKTVTELMKKRRVGQSVKDLVLSFLEGK
jgi:hypothetical protein